MKRIRKLWPGRDEFRSVQYALFLVVYTVWCTAWFLFWLLVIVVVVVSLYSKLTYHWPT